MINATKHRAFAVEIEALPYMHRTILGTAYFTAREWGLDANDAVDVARAISRTLHAHVPAPN